MSKDYDYRRIEAAAQADWDSIKAYQVSESAVDTAGHFKIQKEDWQKSWN